MLIIENARTFCIGLDVYHASKALALLARYHAMGIAMSKIEPSFTEIAIEQCKILGIKSTHYTEHFENGCKIFENYQPLNKYLDKVEYSIKKYTNDAVSKNIQEWKLDPEYLQNPWTTITHGDFWVNNILFHKDENDFVDDVKLIDYQMYRYNSALEDLLYFFCISLDEESTNNHVDELLDVYYDNFIRTLKIMNCDTAVYSKQNFQGEFRKEAKIAFARCALVLKYFVFEVDEKDENNRELHKTVINSESSQIYKDRLMRLVDLYETQKWF